MYDRDAQSWMVEANGRFATVSAYELVRGYRAQVHLGGGGGNLSGIKHTFLDMPL